MLWENDTIKFNDSQTIIVFTGMFRCIWDIFLAPLKHLPVVYCLLWQEHEPAVHSDVHAWWKSDKKEFLEKYALNQQSENSCE